jgi:hypothetical protein
LIIPSCNTPSICCCLLEHQDSSVTLRDHSFIILLLNGIRALLYTL